MRILTSPLFILIVALALRLWSLANYTSIHPHQALGTIPFLFEPGNIAYSLANGHGFSSPFRVDTGPTAWMTPVYPALLAAIFRLLGNYTYSAFLAAASLNIAFSTLTCLPLYYAAQRLAGRSAGAIAAWLWAIFPTAIILPYESFWDASIAALLMATLLWATFALTKSNTIHAWYAYGLLWGFAIMTSATLASLLPFLLGWAAWCCRRSFRSQSLEKPALALGIALLCCIPWTVRNYTRFHTLVPLRSVMGLSLYVGNNDRADGIGTAGLHPISNQTERNRYIELGEIAYMDEKRSHALSFMSSHPATTLRLTANRFLAVWTGGTIHPFTDFLRGPLWSRWVLFCEAFTTLGAFTGLILFYRKDRYGTRPLAAVVLIFPLPYYLTIAPARYRHPLEPVLVLLTGAAATLIWQTRSSGLVPPNRSAKK